MDVTPEMIEAVEQHQRAERKRQEEEAREKRYREYKERLDRQLAEHLAKAREIIPGMTEEQFDALTGVFADYMENAW